MTRKAKVEALEKFAFRKRRKHSNDIDETRGEDETPGEDEPESSANVNESAAPQNEGVALDDETNKILEINREVQSSNSFRPPHICKEKGGFFREKYSAVCIPCFDKQLLCSHSLEIPLRLILIGHNPSKHAWASGNFYSNPSNRMWKLLFEASVMPSLMDRERRNKASQENPNDEVRWLRPGEKRWWTIAISDETEKRGNLSNRSASELGIGFTDIGTRPGNDASTYDRKTMLLWGEDLLNRFRNHIERIKLTLKYLRRQSGCSEEEQNVTDEEASPAIVAFTGKRQFSQLFDPPLKRCSTGRQDFESLPPNWPFPATTEVWVLASSSGRAAMTKEARFGPYSDLGKRISQIPWPRIDKRGLLL